MIQVELGDFKKLGNDMAELLRDRIKTDVALKGSVILVPDKANGERLSTKDVKLQVKHVLYHLGVSHEYRVLADHDRIIIEKVKKVASHAQHEGTVPSPYQTLPYLFPG